MLFFSIHPATCISGRTWANEERSEDIWMLLKGLWRIRNWRIHKDFFFCSFNFTLITVWKFGVETSTLTQTADDGTEKWRIFLSSQVVYDPPYFSWGFFVDAVLVLIEFWEWACKGWSSFLHCVVSGGGIRERAPLCLHSKRQRNWPMTAVLGRRERKVTGKQLESTGYSFR